MYILFYDEYGYISKNEFSKLNVDNIIDECKELFPFIKSFTNHKPYQNLVTIKKFRDIKNKKLEDINLSVIKNLAKIYSVTSSGSKKEIADRIEKLRGVIIYNKK